MNTVAKAAADGYAPKILAFENVTGLITSGQGQDFVEVVRAFQAAGYKFGALEIDARWYLPQSRPRVFVIGVAAGSGCKAKRLMTAWHRQASCPPPAAKG